MSVDSTKTNLKVWIHGKKGQFGKVAHASFQLFVLPGVVSPARIITLFRHFRVVEDRSHDLLLLAEKKPSAGKRRRENTDETRNEKRTNTMNLHPR